MKYQILILKSAEREMNRLPEDIHKRLVRKIISLEEEPRPYGIKKLRDREEYRLKGVS